MNIILEGPDGGGKSTLAALISGVVDMPTQQGSGPPRGAGEIEKRLEEYLALDDRVFDRHPAVSQPIYAQLRGETLSEEFRRLVSLFYLTKPVVIYCRSEDSSRHVVKAGENPAHVAALTARYADLVRMYDDWASRRAHLVYRIGDDPLLIARVLQGMTAAVICHAKRGGRW